MQARSITARLVVATFLAVAGSVSPPLSAQTIGHPQPHWPAVPPPPWALGVASGASFGAHVSAMNPSIRCSGRRSFSCGAHFDPRPVFAGALIGGVIAALSAPMYYDAPYTATPDTRSLQQDLYGSAESAIRRAPSIADSWQQFGEPHRDERAQRGTGPSQFVEGWQRFFEPSQ